MRINPHETQASRTAGLLLIFVRSVGDIREACAQIEAFLAFCRHHPKGSWARRPLLGAWIDEHAVTDFPEQWKLRSPTHGVVTVTVQETFSRGDLWTIVSFAHTGLETEGGSELSHDKVIDALLAAAPDATGGYSPIFARGTPKSQVRAEVSRLNARYPSLIEPWLYYDPVTGALTLAEE
ncbi:MAG: hypothetical protein ACYCXG_08445 [Acidiferrobacter sp.]